MGTYDQTHINAANKKEAITWISVECAIFLSARFVTIGKNQWEGSDKNADLWLFMFFFLYFLILYYIIIIIIICFCFWYFDAFHAFDAFDIEIFHLVTWDIVHSTQYYSTAPGLGRWLSPDLDCLMLLIYTGENRSRPTYLGIQYVYRSKYDSKLGLFGIALELYTTKTENLEKRAWQGWRSEHQPLTCLGFLKLPTFACLPFAGENTGEEDRVATFSFSGESLLNINVPRCIFVLPRRQWQFFRVFLPKNDPKSPSQLVILLVHNWNSNYE